MTESILFSCAILDPPVHCSSWLSAKGSFLLNDKSYSPSSDKGFSYTAHNYEKQRIKSCEAIDELSPSLFLPSILIIVESCAALFMHYSVQSQLSLG